MIKVSDAVIALGGKSFSVQENDINKVYFNKGNPLNITTEQIKEKYDELVAEFNKTEPMRLLREKRYQLIAATDWWVLPDRTPTQAQLDYRQALRDLPANSPNVALDANGDLTGVTWPVKPE